MAEGYVTWKLPEETVKLMVLFGLARMADDGVHEFTEDGSKWIKDYCEAAIKRHQDNKKPS